MTDKLTPPFAIHSNESAFWLSDAAGTRFSFTYYTDTPVVGTGADKPSQKVARQLTVQVQKLPELLGKMGETTQPLLSRMSPEERAALRKWIEESGWTKGEPEAMRHLTKEQLITMGLLALGSANRGKGNLRKP